MSKRAQNFFLFFGLTVLAIMVAQLDFDEVWKGISHAGYWFLAVVVLWAFLYIFNTSAWYIIIKSDDHSSTHNLSFFHIYRLTVSGFALNYATPGGLMGGEPYRIMSISPIVGAERASSSVILYAMTHMFSHFWFWAISIVLFLVTQVVTLELGILLALCTVFCILGLWFFMAGYRKGLANRALNIARHIPFLKRWAEPFIVSHKEQLDTIDSQISALHKQNPRTFVTAVLLELTCRIVSSLEIYFILLVLMPEVSFIQCILILAFTSLFANLMFFIPLQLVGREGGFLMSTAAFGISTSAGIFVALLVRLRELIWTAIGLALIKLK
ncbi:MAG: flippase-like domain-containing protein [Prevotella sp.]|nr:flippase-like domain-containing protein [Prevotella sp.]